jgi:hypothetical protein
VSVDKIIGLDNYGAAVLNFDDFTAEIINLGVDSTYWNNNNVYPLQNSGYMFLFNGDDNYSEKLVIFTDASCQEIGRYTGTTGDYSSDSFDGRFVSFEDEDNGVLTYSNGKDVFTYTWNPETHLIDIEYDWYSVTSDNTFIIKKYELGEWNYNGDGESYLVNSNSGTTTLFKTWTDGTYVRHKMQPNTNFIVVETEIQGVSNSYINLEIYDTSGTILETVSLTGETYNNRIEEFLGTNKYCVIYYNDNDSDVDYKIIHYNGETTTLTQTSHIKGLNYPNRNIRGNSDFSPSSTENGGVVITFYNQVDGDIFGSVVDYCDIVYMLDSQSSFNTYEVADNVEVSIETSGQLGNIYRTRVSTGNFLGVLTISTTGGTITNTGIPISGITTYINEYYLGDKTLYLVMTDDAYTAKVLLVNNNGSISTLTKNLSGQYSYSLYSQGNLGYVKFSLSGDTSEGYYVYSGSTGFTSTGIYNSNESPDDYYNGDTFLDSNVIVLYNEGEREFRVLSSTGITSEFQFPSYNEINVKVGESKFMIVYNDNITNKVKINIYNLSGQLLNSHTTSYTDWDDVYAIKDRFFVRFYNGEGIDQYFLVSEESITSVILDNYDREWSPNDYTWWDNW